MKRQTKGGALHRLWQALPWLWMAAAYLFDLWYQLVPGKWIVDSDLASEMILSDLLNKEGSIISHNWFYSTELKVVNLQWFYRLGLLLFPDDWHLARAFGMAVTLALYAACMLFFVKCARLGRPGLWMVGTLLWPFGQHYLVYAIYGGYYLVYTFFYMLVLALVLCSRHLISKLLAGGIFVMGCVALGMTYSRASWVGMACAMVVLVFLWKPKLIPAFAVLCVVMVPFLPDTIWHRVLTIFNPADTSTASRIPLYQAALEVIRTSPVSGAGLGTAAVQDYISDFNLYHAEAPFVHAHNFYLQVWIEAGLLGFLGFVGSMLWNIKKAARTVRHCAPSAARTITCAGAAALCGAMVCGLADYLWNYPRVMCIFWFVFALTIAGIKVCRRETEAA